MMIRNRDRNWTTVWIRLLKTGGAVGFVFWAATLVSCCARGPAASDASAPSALSSAIASRFAGQSPPPEQFHPAGGPPLRVLTWNVQHFVDEHDSPYIDNEWDNERRDMSARREDFFVRAIQAINADVVVLQEVESAAQIQRLARERFPEMKYDTILAVDNDTWHQNVVLMSRVPIGAMTAYSGVWTPIVGHPEQDGWPPIQRLTNNRIWAAEIWVNEEYWFLLAGAHLKAGGGERNAAWRLGQARYLRGQLARMLAAEPDMNVLVAGDLNAEPHYPEMQYLMTGALESPDPLVRAAWAPLPSEDEALVRLIDTLEGCTDCATHPSRGPRRRIDHLLPNPGMARELVAGSMKVVRPLSDTEMAEASDHLPVVAEFTPHEK